MIAAVITAAVSYLGTWFTFLGFYSFLVAFAAGFAAIWLVKKAISNRRSPILKYVMSGAALLAGIIPAVIQLVREYRYYGGVFVGGIYGIPWDLVYAVIITGYIYYQLRN